jgi:hypothetical protein
MTKHWKDEEEQRSTMLAMLEDASDWVESEAIEEATMMNQWGVFEAGMDLLSEGHAVCLQHLEGSWLNFTTSEADVSYRLARSQGDLAQMRYMLDAQHAFLSRINVGIEKAQERFALATTTSQLHGT